MGNLVMIDKNVLVVSSQVVGRRFVSQELNRIPSVGNVDAFTPQECLQVLQEGGYDLVVLCQDAEVLELAETIYNTPDCDVPVLAVGSFAYEVPYVVQAVLPRSLHSAVEGIIGKLVDDANLGSVVTR